MGRDMTDTQNGQDTHESERPDVLDFAALAGEPLPETAKTGRNWTKIIAVAASAIAAGSLAFAIMEQVNTQSTIARAAKNERAAVQRMKAAEARPPKVVIHNVTQIKPVFGRSTLMGVFATGSIQASGIYTGGNSTLDYTPNDATCSAEYTNLSSIYTSVAINRPTFMSACQNSMATTLKQDTTP